MTREKRIARRQPLRYSAWVAVTPTKRFGCTVSDVSQTGARLDVNDSTAVPDRFVLLLSSNGAARRFCRVMWRKPNQVGVKFARTFAETANLAPDAKAEAPAKTEAETQPAPAEASESAATA